MRHGSEGGAKAGFKGVLYGNALPVDLVDIPFGAAARGRSGTVKAPGAQGGPGKAGRAGGGRTALEGPAKERRAAVEAGGENATAGAPSYAPGALDGSRGAHSPQGEAATGAGGFGTPEATGAAEAGQGGRGHAAGGSPNLVLTDERLAELARKYEEDAPAGERGKTLMLDTSEIKYRRYLLDMKTRIENRWEYPQAAARNGWQGKLRIDFTVLKDGSLGTVMLDKSSNRPALDEAAITALRLSAPFAPFPEDFSIESITIHGSFEYVIYDPRGR